EKKENLSALTTNPIAISARDGENLDLLRERMDRALPSQERERLVLPLNDDTMSVISWVHDNAHVKDVSYGDESVVIDFEAKPVIVEQTRAKAEALT
ncbi:MAG: GTPase HflX, partial [Halobacteriaceae archaeon]